MTETALRFLAALSPEQRARATFAFDDPERLNWTYVPAPRRGLPLREMTPWQRHLASALLSAGLSQAGYIKAVTIMSLEEVLRVIENDDGQKRDPEKYFFSIFGTPSETGIWGYRVEGHHVSQNYTLVNGRVVDAPSFFGANPAVVLHGPRAGLRVLAAEEDLGRAVVGALDEEQRRVAIVDPVAYADILTAASRRAALEGQPSGLPAARLSGAQFDRLMELLREYAANVEGALRARREEQIHGAGDRIHFAWAGGVKRGDPHYYRVQTADFLIEYDNTQNGANHVHAVWRDFEGDFGGDLLREHYHASHTVQCP
jgi:hypothetical protein